MFFDSSTPWKAFLNGRHPSELLPASALGSACSPCAGIIHLRLPGTPPVGVGANSHIGHHQKAAAERDVKSFARAGTRRQPVTIFAPGSPTYAFSRIHWERSRQIRDPDNANGAMKFVYDTLQAQNYLADDRDLISQTAQVQSGERQGWCEVLLIGELNPLLPADHPMVCLPVTSLIYEAAAEEHPWAMIWAHRPEDLPDLLLIEEDGTLQERAGAVFVQTSFR